MSKVELDLDQITKDAISEIVRRAVMAVIEQHVGVTALPDYARDAIRAEAKHLCDTDPEVKQMIRESLIYWIRKPLAG